MKNRLPMLLLVVCLISCTVASAVYAKYVKNINADVTVDVVGNGDIEIEIVQNTEDDTYTIRHTSNSKIPGYIRFTIVVNWKHKTDATLWYISPSDVVCAVPCAQKLGDYYYGLAGGDAEIALEEALSGIKVTTTAVAPDGYELDVQILAEAIQCMPVNVVESAWGVKFENGDWKKIAP